MSLLKFLPMLLVSSLVHAQQLAPLTVEKIMRDPNWIGAIPTALSWSDDSKEVYFNWNPDKNPGDSLYAFSIVKRVPAKVPAAVRRKLPTVPGDMDKARKRKVYEKNGDLFLLEVTTNTITTITATAERESGPVFSFDEKKIIFASGQNLFRWTIASGMLEQLSDFRKGNKKPDPKMTDQEKSLTSDQLAYMKILKERQQKTKAAGIARKGDQPRRPKEIFIDDKDIDNIQLSPDEKYITYRLTKNTTTAKNTAVPNYVTESGFTANIPGRTKVGAAQSTYEMFVYDIAGDTVFQVKVSDVPGITDQPDFVKDYPAKGDQKSKPEPRQVIIHGPVWSEDGQRNAVVIRSLDHKDRWIMSLDLAAQKLSPIDRQRDEAWVGGPGTGSQISAGSVGWLADNRTLWFVSEESGYAHLYTHNVETGKRTALTPGKYEVQSVDLSNDKKSFYIVSNEVHPGEKHFYRLPAGGGKPERITTMSGGHEVTISPDEKWIAYRYAYSNKPWEIFLQENKPGAKPQQITNSISAEFNSYPWREPELTLVRSRDSVDISARLYRPAQPNGAAVIFVHGAGYLQNVHRWWSSYYREYMFHNLLADQGYTVLDMDYRASAGYGRDWRTGIYRFTGGKDLNDNLDGAKWLVEKYQIDPKRIGIYGGSYGGFITLMAMFNAPGVFAAGAALRPVTDWAHYNHAYTSAILNEPSTDSIAYARSSPLHFAEGLKGRLLICHGMVDVNVHFQDAVLLTQRLIELGKDNWEMAVYPVEDHAFLEASSWTDEYKRILKLFEEQLK